MLRRLHGQWTCWRLPFKEKTPHNPRKQMHLKKNAAVYPNQVKEMPAIKGEAPPDQYVADEPCRQSELAVLRHGPLEHHREPGGGQAVVEGGGVRRGAR